jgi:hypothetical protein
LIPIFFLLYNISILSDIPPASTACASDTFT